MTAPALELSDVAKSFAGFPAVDGVSLSLAKGERRALIGPNGAGKTTLFNLISGRLRIDRGEVRYRGAPIHHLSPNEICTRGIARTFQITSIYPRLSALANVQVALFSRHGHARQVFRNGRVSDVEEAMQALRSVGLEERAFAESGTMSYGDQKRLELAMVLALQPSVLLLDEPTAGVEAGARRSVVELVRRICIERDLTLLFCEHDMEAVFSIADKITVLHEGRILVEGTPDEIRSNASVRSVYLGSGRGGTVDRVAAR